MRFRFGENVFLVAILYVASIITTLVAALCPFWSAQMKNLLQPCYELARDNNKPWKDGAVTPIYSGDFVDFIG